MKRRWRSDGGDRFTGCQFLGPCLNWPKRPGGLVTWRIDNMYSADAWGYGRHRTWTARHWTQKEAMAAVEEWLEKNEKNRPDKGT